mgnify:CR=1 FL=1
MATGSGLILKTSSNLPALINDNSLVAYLEQIKKFPVLSEAEEQKLLADFHEQNNLQAAQVLVTSHLRLAAKIAYT